MKSIQFLAQKMLFFVLFGIFSTSFAQRLVIQNVNIIPINTNTVLKNKTILIENGIIIKIDDTKNIPTNTKTPTTVIDAKGKYVMPALADMHVHLPKMEGLDSLLVANVAAGVGRIRIMNSELNQLELKEKISKGKITKTKPIIAPNLYFSHIITRDNKYSLAQFDSLMKVIKKQDLKFIKMFSIADEQTFDNLMQSANKHKVTVCGHFPSMVSLEKVIKSGFKSIEHLAGYLKTENFEKIDDFAKMSKENNIYNCPTMDFYMIAYYFQYPDNLKTRLVMQNAPNSYVKKWENMLSADVTAAGGKDKVIEFAKSNAKVREKLNVILKKLYDSNCLLLVGSDPAGIYQLSGFSMADEMLAWSVVGIDNYYILKSATSTPAAFFGEEKQWGTVEVGKSGDLIILDKNPLEDIKNITTVEKTIINGKVFEKAILLKDM